MSHKTPLSDMPVMLSRKSSRKQTGVVLIVALALLVVIGFSSAFILRNSLFGDDIANTLAANQSATHAAEVALRYCESEVLAATPAADTNVIPLPITLESTAWKTTKWAKDEPGYIAVPAEQLVLADSKLKYQKLPECVVEQINIQRIDPSGGKPYGLQVTARGYSPDYQGTAGDRTGAQVILQSTLRMAYCKPELKMVCD